MSALRAVSTPIIWASALGVAVIIGIAMGLSLASFAHSSSHRSATFRSACAACESVSPAATPTPAMVPVGRLTAEQLSQLKAQSDLLSQQFQAVSPTALPSIEPIGVMTNERAWAQQQVDCLAGAGFEATMTPDGSGLSYGNPAPGDEPQQELAIYVCEAQYAEPLSGQ